MRISIQGELGSFHHAAALRWYGDDITIVPCTTFKLVFDAIQFNKADAAMVAIENSFYGSINEVYDLLLQHSFPIVGEVPERIHQCLISCTPTELTNITHVYSHPVALAQCSMFLDTYLPNAERIEYYDTAASVEYIKKLGDIHTAAIAGTLAAKMHACRIVKKGIENHDTNYTRFLAVNPLQPLNTNTNKASLVLRTQHTPGALYNALGTFANYDMNLTKLQSRPIPGKVWQYMFYVDIQASPDKLAIATEDLRAQGCDVTVLGQYCAAPIITA